LRAILRYFYQKLQVLKYSLQKGLPNSYVKRHLVKNAFNHSGCSVFIETGTLHGRMIEEIQSLAKRVYSIELDERYFNAARLKFKGLEHVTIIQGDSGTELGKLLAEIKEPTFFWLDAHYSGGDTGKSDIDTPIISELSSILNHGIKGHVVWIDDARCFDGSNDYPTLEELERLVKLPIQVKADIIRFTTV
jgi:hypothetical protein